MIRTPAAFALTLVFASCASAQTPPASPLGNPPAERHFPRNEKIVPLEPAPNPTGLDASGVSSGGVSSGGLGSGRLSPGALAYGVRCKGCHEPPTPGAPDRLTMAKLSSEAIVASLTTGKMKIVAPGMPVQEMREVAAFLTGKTMPPTGPLPEAQP
jgi:hypothetical protein